MAFNFHCPDCPTNEQHEELMDMLLYRKRKPRIYKGFEQLHNDKWKDELILKLQTALSREIERRRGYSHTEEADTESFVKDFFHPIESAPVEKPPISRWKRFKNKFLKKYWS